MMGDMFVSFFGAGIWAVIKAVLMLVLACIVAAVVKSMVVKLLTKTGLRFLSGKTDASADGGKRVSEHIGKLVHLLVFLLFVPGIFESLGVREMSVPILNLLNTMWGYLPNILAAVIVLWVGLFIAKLVRELLTPVFDRMKINRLQEMAGIEAEGSAKLSDTLAYIVYVLILIPVVITTLQVLDIQAVSGPAIRMLDTMFGFIPNIMVALVIIVVGCMVAKLSGNIVESLIASAGLDAKLIKLPGMENSGLILSKTAGRIVHTVMVIFFVVESFGVLHLQVLTNIGSAVIGYLPRALAAVLILLGCFVCNTMVQKSLQKNGHKTGALFAGTGIWTAGGFMVLSELGIAAEIVNTAFVVAITALALAFAIAFGIGGRQSAERLLEKLEEKKEDK